MTRMRILLVVAVSGLVGGPVQAQQASGGDIDPATQAGKGFTPYNQVWGMDSDNKIVAITTISSYIAAKDLSDSHCYDGSHKYMHWHFWDTNAKTDTFSAANQTLVNTFWNAVFGVSAVTGNGKLGGDTVAQVTWTNRYDKGPNMYAECGTYAYNYCNCAGANKTWQYAIFAMAVPSANTNMTTLVSNGPPVNPKTTPCKPLDMLFYSNGTVGLGYHYTCVQSVGTGDNEGAPQTLRWKFMFSGIYTLSRTKDFYDTPMYWGPRGTKPTTWESWTFYRLGAGIGETDILSVRRPK